MDTGVFVLAAAEGVVTFAIDTIFDREKRSVISKGLGNYLAISHPNKYYSYYGHLKKNSLRVAIGDTVLVGDTIAEVGSSGNSTDPHLHFELYYDSLFVVDPFQGPCGNPSSLWLRTPLYETEVNVWDQGMHNQQVDIDDLRERAVTVTCCPFRFPKTSSNPLIYWAHLYGLKKNTTLTIEWYNPDQILWFEYDFTFDRDWWYYYLWSDILNTDLPEGNWYVRLVYEGNEIARQDFVVDGTTFNRDININEKCSSNSSQSLDELLRDKNVRIYNSTGMILSSLDKRQYTNQVLLVHYMDQNCLDKMFFIE